VLSALTGRLGERGAGVRQRLLDTWRSENGQRMAELEAACADGDLEAVQRVLHAVRGSSGSLGALRLSQACLAWEERLREGHDVACPDVLADLRPLVQQTAGAFRR
jgi:HPt (histidine-containing phosphotransfer) domain-containing protein